MLEGIKEYTAERFKGDAVVLIDEVEFPLTKGI
jgi:hypothetical protein